MKSNLKNAIKKLVALFMAATMFVGVMSIEYSGYASDNAIFDIVKEGEIIYSIVGSGAKQPWEPMDTDNMLEQTEIEGVYKINYKVSAMREGNEWARRFAIIQTSYNTMNYWNRILLGVPQATPEITDLTTQCLTNIRINVEEDTEVTVYFDSKTYGIAVKDMDGKDVPYLIGWVGNDDEEIYYTPEELTEMSVKDYIAGLSRADLSRIEWGIRDLATCGIDQYSDMPDFVRLRDQLIAKLEGNNTEDYVYDGAYGENFVGYEGYSELLISKDGLTVKGYIGNPEEIIIPEGVTEIEPWAFWNCSNLTKIQFPESLKTVDNSAFLNCIELEEINVSYANESYKSVDGVLYSKDGKELIFYPSGKKDSLYLIPEKTEKIWTGAFFHCDNLTNIILPGSLINIEDGMFSLCDNLTEINILNGLVAIKDSAFCGCYNLRKVNIPKSVEEISETAFYGCSYLTEINIEEDNKVYKSEDGVVYSKDGKKLILYPAGKRDSNFTIPELTTTIGKNSFFHCSNLTNIILPDSLINIESGAFSRCGNLTEISIPNGLVAIEDSVFSGCYNLRKVNIPKSVEEISETAFYECSCLTEINIEEDNKVYKSEAGVVYSKDGKELILYPAGKSDSNFTIPELTTTIGENSFQNCRKLEQIIIPEGVTSIGCRAFAGCSGLDDIVIPKSVVSIDDLAFENDDNMIFYCNKDSYAHSYVKKLNLRYILLEDIITLSSDDNILVMGIKDGLTDNIKLNTKLLTSDDDSYKKIMQYINKYGKADNIIDFIAYDMNFTDTNSNIVIPDTNVTVKIPVPEKYTDTGCDVYIFMEGDIIPLEFKLKSGNIEFRQNLSDKGYTYIIVEKGISLPKKQLSMYDVEDGTVYYTIAGGVNDWNPLNRENQMEETKWDGVYVKKITVQPFDEENAWDNRFKILKIDDESVSSNGWSHEVCLGTKEYGDSQTYFSIESDKELTVSVYYDSTTGAVLMLDDEGKIVNYKFSWVDTEDDFYYTTVAEFATCGYVWPKSNIIVRALPNIARRNEILYKKIMGTLTEEDLNYVDPSDRPLEKQEVTFHFYNSENWNRVGAWIYEGIVWDRNALPTDRCILRPAEEYGEVGTPLYPGAEMEYEGNGWYKVTCSYEDFYANGTIMFFNNYVGDSILGLTTTQEDIDILRAAGITLTDTALKYQTGNFIIINHEPATDYYIEWNEGSGYKTIDGMSDVISTEPPQSYLDISYKTPELILSDDGIKLEYEKDSIDAGVSLITKEITKASEDDEASKTEKKRIENIIEKAIVDKSKAIKEIKYTVYDITLVNGKDETVQPNSEVTVRVPIPEGYSENDCKVYRLEENGKFTNMKAELVNNMLQFTTEHFSIYVITEDMLEAKEKGKENILYGDANNDGVVDSVDAGLIKKHLAGYKDLGINEEACDVNGDGTVTSADVVLVLKKLAGYNVTLGK